MLYFMISNLFSKNAENHYIIIFYTWKKYNTVCWLYFSKKCWKPIFLFCLNILLGTFTGRDDLIVMFLSPKKITDLSKFDVAWFRNPLFSITEERHGKKYPVLESSEKTNVLRGSAVVIQWMWECQQDILSDSYIFIMCSVQLFKYPCLLSPSLCCPSIIPMHLWPSSWRVSQAWEEPRFGSPSLFVSCMSSPSLGTALSYLWSFVSGTSISPCITSSLCFQPQIWAYPCAHFPLPLLSSGLKLEKSP